MNGLISLKDHTTVKALGQASPKQFRFITKMGPIGGIVSLSGVARTGHPTLIVGYALLIVLLIGVLSRISSTIGPDGVTVKNLLRQRHVTWTEVQTIDTPGNKRIELTLNSGESVKLPAPRRDTFGYQEGLRMTRAFHALGR